MIKTKFVFTLTLLLGLLFAQVGQVAAAPAQTSTTIDGTVTQVTCETDSATSTNTFLVTVQATDGTTQTVRIDQQTAIDLGLVTPDGSNNVDCASDAVNQELAADQGKDVSIDSSTVIPDQTEEESVNPISALLASFFDTDASVIDGYHNDGFGFGVIAQALWMSQNLTDDASMTEDILNAKESGDYSAFTLPDGTTPTNWGQLRKALLNKKQSLGVVVSGHGDSDTPNEHGNGNGNNNGHNNGNDNNENGHGNGNGNNGNGNGHGNGNGNNKP